MADYLSKTRTNYFHVTDEAAFRALIANVSADSPVEVYTDTHDDLTTYGFCCNGSINGLRVLDGEELCDEDMKNDDLIDELQKLISPGDAAIITEVGAEAMHYLSASAMIITASGTEYVDLASLAITTAANMLKIKDWKTKMDY